MAFDEIKLKFQRIDTVVNIALRRALDRNLDVVEDLNRSQLFAGVDRNLQELTPPYAQLTRSIKTAKGQPIDRVTLRDTGSFYRSITARTAPTALEIDATDPKTTKLEFKYGEDILGLSEISVEELKDEILPDLQQELRTLLNV